VTRLEGPRSLADDDDLGAFACGVPELDAWLSRRARKAGKTGTARTYVVTDLDADAVAGYYCLSSFSLTHMTAGGGALARNAPDPIPVILLGRLAVDLRYRGERLGEALLKDALVRSIAAAHHIGARALVVHAKDERARGFYERYSFERLVGDPDSLYLLLGRLV